MKKIVHLINGLDSGGAETVLVRLVMNDNHNEHIVISLKDEGFYGDYLKKNNIKVEYLGLNRMRNVLLGIGLPKLLYFLRKHQCYAIMTWMPHSCLLGGIAAKILGIKKIIWNFRGASENLKDNTRMHRIVLRLCRGLQNFIPKKTVVCANYVNDILKDYGFETSNFEVIYNGYDTSLYSRNLKSRKSIRADFSIPDNLPLIGMIARWHPQKNHDLLIESLKIVSSKGLKFKCLLMGDGIETEKVRSVIKKSGISDKLILKNETSRIPDIMSSLDIHVLSSKFGEGFPNVLAEAMSCEVPCIATDIGDSKLIIGNTGWISKNDCLLEMSQSIEEALLAWKNKDEWSKRSLEARERVIFNFDLSRMVKNYQKLF